MNDEGGCLSVMVIVVFSLCFLASWFGFGFGEAKIQEQAIERGFAERIAGDDGGVIFKWKEASCQGQ